MKKFLLYSLCAIALVACQKEVKKEQPVAGGAPATFNVFSPETKTTIDGLSVKWAEGDKIRVYGHNTSTDAYDNGTYTLSSGAGTTAGVFTKDSGEELTGTYDAYYAVYPSVRSLTFSGSPLKMQLDKVSKNQYAVDNSKGFDPSFAVMTAAYDGSKLVFTHGAGYIKFVLTEDNISKVAIELTNNCLVQQPTYIASTGEYSAGGSGCSTVELKPSGDANFTKGVVYYAPVFPRPDDASKKISNLTVTCTGGSTFTTTHFDNKVVEYGEVFDLGILRKTHVDASAISGVDVAGVSTTHSISYVDAVGWTPSIQGFTGCVSSASLVSTDVIATNPSAGTINYTVGAYDALVGNTGTIVVRLSKVGEDPIDKTINVTQSTTASSTYTWNISTWGAQSAGGSSDPAYYYYDSGTSSYVTSDTKTTVGNIYFSKDLTVVATGSYYAANFSGGSLRMYIPVERAGTLHVWATLNQASTATGKSSTLNVKYGSNTAETESLSSENGDGYDTSAALAGAKEYTFTMNGTQNEIQIYKSGSNGLRIYKVVYVED